MGEAQLAAEEPQALTALWHDGTTCNVTDEGWCVDPDSGEVLGHVDEVTPLADIAVIVKRRANAAARQTGLGAQMAMLVKGVQDRFQPKIDRETRLLAFYDKCLEPHIKTVRLAVQNKAKGKSMDYDFGRIQFTKTGGNVEVLEDDKAVRYLLDESPAALAVTLDLALLPEGLRTDILDALSATDLDALEPGAVKYNIRKTKAELPDGALASVTVAEFEQLQKGDTTLEAIWQARTDEAKTAALEHGDQEWQPATEPTPEYTRGMVAVRTDDWHKWSVKH